MMKTSLFALLLVLAIACGKPQGSQAPEVQSDPKVSEPAQKSEATVKLKPEIRYYAFKG